MAKSDFDKEAMRREVQEQIASILKRKKVKIEPADISEGVSLTTQLGIDSLDILQLVATLEKNHGIKIPEAELKSMDDLKGVLRALEANWSK